jgi:hypothetical protein
MSLGAAPLGAFSVASPTPRAISSNLALTSGTTQAVIHGTNKFLTTTDAQSASITKFLTRPAITLASPELFKIPRGMAHNVTPLFPESINAGKAIARAVSIGDVESLVALKTTAKSPLISSGESLARQSRAGKPLAVVNTESVTAARGYPRTLSASDGSTLGVTRLKLLGLIVSISGGEIASAAKQIGKGVSIALAAVLTRRAAVARPIGLVANTQFSFAGLPGRWVSFSAAETLTGIQHRVSASVASVSQPEAVTASKPAIRPFAANIYTVALISIARQLLHIVGITQGTALSAAKLASKAIAAAVQAQFITIGRSVGHLASALSPAALAVQRTVAHRQGTSHGQVVTQGRSNARNIAAAITEAVSVAHFATYGFLQNFTHTSLFTAARKITHPVAFGVAGALGLANRFTRFLTLLPIGEVLITLKGQPKGIAALSGNIASVQLFVSTRAIAITLATALSPQLLTLAAIGTQHLSKALSFTQAALLTLARQPGKAPTFTMPQVFTLMRLLPRRINAVQAARVITQVLGSLVTRGMPQFLTVAAVRTGLARTFGVAQPDALTLTPATTRPKVVPAPNASLVRATLQKFASANPILVLLGTSQAVQFGRAIAKAMTGIASPQFVSTVHVASHLRTIATALVQAANVAKSAGRILAASLGQTALTQVRVGKVLQPTLASAMLLFKGRPFARSIGSAESLAVQRQHQNNIHTVLLAAGQLLSLAHRPAKALVAVSGSQVSRLVAVTRAIPLATAQFVLAGRIVGGRTISTVSSAVVSVARQAAHVRVVVIPSPLKAVITRVHGFGVGLSQAAAYLLVKQTTHISRTVTPQMLTRAARHFTTPAIQAAQILATTPVRFRLGVSLMIQMAQSATAMIGSVRAWPRVIDPHAMILSGQRLVVSFAAKIAPVFPASVVLRMGRALRPLYARRRFIKR